MNIVFGNEIHRAILPLKRYNTSSTSKCSELLPIKVLTALSQIPKNSTLK